MTGKIETELGTIQISNDVIAKIAAIVTSNCYGVVGMAYRSRGDGFASMLRGDTVSKGVKITVLEDNTLLVELHIISQYGVNIAAISQSIIGSVSYQIKSLTGFDVKDVKVHVESVRVNGN